jgi:ATP-dependent RNA helicase DeaD
MQNSKKAAKPESAQPAQTPEIPQANTFAELNLHPKLLKTLEELGYEEPTPIQSASFAPLLEGKDFIGQAATGTGKTAAFALPLIQRLAALGKDRPQPAALILVPTRELATQVAEAIHRYGKPLDISVLPIYGGQSFGLQLRALQRGIDVIVATPGRALDHISRETLRLDGIQTVVLDEADEMLDMGFAEDLEAILKETPSSRQTVLFSATLPPRITAIAKRHLSDPIRIQIAKELPAQGVAPKVRQTAYIVQRANKLPALTRVLDLESPTSALVFCRTRTMVDELTEKLSARGYRAQSLHGGMTQDLRARVIKRLKAAEIDLVIATDVAARGLDIDILSHVINYDVPTTPESYVHRIGRVGRAGREGVAITMADPRESRLLRVFEQVARHKILIAQVPTIADLRARQLESTRAELHKTILAGDLDHFRVALESLAQEFDMVTIALAAVKLAHQATKPNDQDETDFIEPPPQERHDHSPARSKFGSRDNSRGTGAGEGHFGGRGTRDGSRPGMTKIFISAGRMAGVRPGDLVGAIANEAGINGQDIGGIDVADRFSLVELPDHVVDDVIQALSRTIIRGKKVTVRRDRQS